MKKAYFLPVVALFLFCLPWACKSQVAINEINFPDSVFRNYVKTNFDKDGNNRLNAEELAAVKTVEIWRKNDLASLDGIWHFWNLRRLCCCNTGLTSLDVGMNPKVEDLYCYDNTGLTSLDVGRNPILKNLYCSNTGLTSLDVSRNPTLKNLDCRNTGLTSLDVSGNPDLEYLDCSNTCLTSLDLSHNPKVEALRCDNLVGMIEIQEAGTADLSRLPGFDVSRSVEWQGGSVEGTVLRFGERKVARYKYLTRYSEAGTDRKDTLSVTLVGMVPLVPITMEYFPDSLFRAYVRENFDGDGNDTLDMQEIVSVREMDLGGKKVTSLAGIAYFPILETLYCSNTGLTSLDVSGNPALKNLYCYNNTGLTSLDLSQNPALVYLNCSNTGLTSLDLSQNPKMEALGCDNLIGMIEIQEAGTADLSRLPGFDVSRSVEWQGGSVEGTVLRFGERKVARYKYLTRYSEAGTDRKDTLSVTLVGTDKPLVPITMEYFPDSLFRAYVRENFDGDGNDTLDMQEIVSVREMDLGGKKVTSLAGIAYFPILETLYCSHTGLTSLDVSQNPALKYLDCSHTGLTSLDVRRNPALEDLYCYDNTGLTSLDVGGNPALKNLYCYNNTGLTSLDLSQNPALVYLNCSNTGLTSLDLSQNPKMEDLRCDNLIGMIEIQEAGTADLSRLPGFDLNRASDWKGGNVRGNILTFHDTVVTYRYATLYSGERESIPAALEFKLVANPEADENAGSAIRPAAVPFAAYARKGNLCLQGVQGIVEVFDLQGRRIYRGTEYIVKLPAQGVYIVRNQGYGLKVLNL